MATKINIVHVGMAIERRIKELGMSKNDFAQKYGIPHTNVVRVLRKPSIDTNKLMTISEILDHNFFEDFCPDREPEGKVTTPDGKEGYVPVSLFETILRERDELKDENTQLKNQISDMQNGLTIKEIAKKGT